MLALTVMLFRVFIKAVRTKSKILQNILYNSLLTANCVCVCVFVCPKTVPESNTVTAETTWTCGWSDSSFHQSDDTWTAFPQEASNNSGGFVGQWWPTCAVEERRNAPLTNQKLVHIQWFCAWTVLSFFLVSERMSSGNR